MAETSIEWADYTFNPWVGCQKVGPGCDSCYAEARDIRFTGGQHWGLKAPRQRTSAANWKKPMTWNRKAAKTGIRHRVFCASLADVFDNAVNPQWRADLFDLIRATPHLDWLLLTKRPGNIAKMLPADWGKGWPNVWLGCTIVNQEEANRDIPKLLAVPAAVRFLSCEPLLGHLDLTLINADNGDDISPLTGMVCRPSPYNDAGEFCTIEGRIDWIICGGESGPKARPMHPNWVRSIREQCAAAGVAFHFKQWGEWGEWGEWGAGSVNMSTGQPVFRSFKDFLQWTHKADTWVNGGACLDADGNRLRIGADFMRARDQNKFPVTITHRIGKSRAGRMLDGRTHDDLPEVA